MSQKVQVHGEVTQDIHTDSYPINPNAQLFLVNISDPNNYDADNSGWVEVVCEGAEGIGEGTRESVKGTPCFQRFTPEETLDYISQIISPMPVTSRFMSFFVEFLLLS